MRSTCSACCCITAGRSLEAVEPLQRAVAMAPTRAEFLNTLGDVHRVLGQYAEARVLFERALASRASRLCRGATQSRASLECRWA